MPSSTDFVFPSLAQIYALVKAIWLGYRPSASFTRGTALWIMTRKLAKLVWREHMTIERMIRAWHPGTTYGAWLDWWLTWFRGEPGRYAAAGSVGTDVLRVVYTGSPGACLNAILTDSSGLSYKITEELTGAGSPEDVSVEAVDVGTVTNLETGDTLTFVSPPTGVTAEATLQGPLDGGRNRETDSEGRLWLLLRIRSPVISGHATQVRDVVEAALPGLVRCYVYPKRQGWPMGFGCVDVAVLQLSESEADRIITSTQEATIEAAVEAALPTHLWLNWRILTVQENDSGGTDVTITFKTATGAPADKVVDWNSLAISASLVVSAYHEGNKTITANMAVTGYGDSKDLQIGDRVYVHNQATVLDVISVGVAGGHATDAMFGFAAWPWGAGLGPSADKIFSGGGMVADIRAAVASLADGLGPEKGSAYYTLDADWRDTAYLLRLQKAGLDVDDYMLDVEVDDIGGGAVDYTPTALTGDTVNLITIPAANVIARQDLT